MKKGFTLIELLAVIVVLVIIATISIFVVFNIIKDARYNSIKASKEIIGESLRKYLVVNNNLIPKNNLDKAEINIQTLMDNKYLKPIKSPIKSGNCSGYAVITKLSNDYSKNIYLNCNEDIKSSIEDKLIAHYLLQKDEYDTSINNNHGTLLGNTIYENEGAKFSTFPSHIDLPIGNEINTVNPLTITMWVKPDQTTGTPIFFASDNGASQRLYMSIYQGKWDVGIGSQAWNGANSNHQAKKEWTHLALVISNGVARLYVNEELSVTKNYINYSLNSNFRLGLHRTYSSTYQFFGSLKDVRVYQRELSHNEILEIVNTK